MKSLDELLSEMEENADTPASMILRGTLVDNNKKLISALRVMKEGLEAIEDPDMPKWTLEQERIGNRAVVANTLESALKILEGE